MKNNGYRKSFVFSNKAEDVALVVRSCVEFIEEPKNTIAVPLEVLSRIKWALTELLINGAKHAGTDESFLQIIFEDHLLILEKTDFGKPLTLAVDDGDKTLSWPLQQDGMPARYEVYQNGMDSLQIEIDSGNFAVFSVTEMADVVMPQLLISTSEHFGLMIIAKASDRFNYVYDELNKKNIFNVIFKCIE